MAASIERQLVDLLQCNILPERSYLAGGTAVYFYLKHRLSVDLDFFTESRFNAELFLAKMKGCVDEVAVESLEQDTLILFLSPEKIKFSLFHYPYARLFPTVATPIGGGLSCTLASIQDLAAMKAVAINQRGSIKGFYRPLLHPAEDRFGFQWFIPFGDREVRTAHLLRLSPPNLLHLF